MLEILKDRELIEANPFATAKIKKVHLLPAFGIDATMYGGRVNSIAELQDSELLLFVDKGLNTIDVARMRKDETEQEIRFTCKKCNESFDNKGKFLSHSRTCKD